MKKVLSIILFFILVSKGLLCYASVQIPKEKSKQYQIEMTKTVQNINTGLNTLDNKTYRNYILDLFSEDYKLYLDFQKDKNHMKRNFDYMNKFSQDASSLNGIGTAILEDLLLTLKNYIDIDAVLEANSNTNYFDFITTNYLKKYRIKGAQDFIATIQMIQPYQMKLMDLSNEIRDYSIEYENAKKLNYIKKYDKKFVDLDDYLMFNSFNGLKQGTIYFTKAKIFQILNNSVLASTYYGSGKSILIQTNKAQELAYGDLFLPFLPVRFTGQYYTYTTLTGMRNTVPVFKEILPAEYKKLSKIPPISDKFYFINPSLEMKPFFIGLQNENITPRDRLFRSGY